LSPVGTDYWPNALYDAREGQFRDGLADGNMRVGGIMHYIELDMNNLRRWLRGQIGASGGNARNENGFIIYFSDRRNNRNTAGRETGEYGFEDVINPPNMTAPPNGALDAGEDLNANGVLDTYGQTPQNLPAGAAAPFDANSRPWTLVPPAAGAAPAAHATASLVARANRPVHYRRALKLVNGGINGGVNNIMDPNLGGVMIASENPVYIQGNFNATTASVVAEPNVPTAVVADSVTVLSNGWNDIRSFIQPNESQNRKATTTGYRVAIISGKTRAFPKPAWAANSFGSDGGAHNFMRALEDWDEVGVTQRYRGSFVSLFFSRQGNGSFKCCDSDAYVRGTRDWAFDTDFLLPTLLPPGTPMFRDVNTLTFRQLLRPTQ
jgi:hypothetical protein